MQLIERDISQWRGRIPTLFESRFWVAVFAILNLNSVLASGSAIADPLTITKEDTQRHMEDYVILHVGIEAGIAEYLRTVIDGIRLSLRKARIGYVGLGVVEDRIVFEVRYPTQGEEATQLIQRDWPKVAVSRAGRSFEIFFEQKDLPRIRRDILVQTLNSVRSNMLAHGFDVDGVRAQGHRCILIPPPAVDQTKEFKQRLSRPKLLFMPIDQSIDPDQGDVPIGFKVLKPYKETYGEILSSYVVRRGVFLSGQHIVETFFTKANEQSVMVITFDIVGELLMFRKLSSTVQWLAIALDDKVFATANADRRQPDRVTVVGDLTSEKAQELATILRAASTPAIVTMVDRCAE